MRLYLHYQDPAGNKINQWFVPEADLRTSGGVYESEMVMSDAPILGDWKFKVILGVGKVALALFHVCNVCISSTMFINSPYLKSL